MLYDLYSYVTIEMTSKSLKLKWNLPWSQWFFLKFSSEKRERARGSDPHPDVCMKVWFEVKVTRGFSLSSPLCGSLSLSRMKISRKTSGTRVSGTMSRKVSPPLTSFPSFLNVSFSPYTHEPASTWCHWKGSAFTTISLTPKTAFTWLYGFDTCTMKCSDFRLETTNSRSSLIDACNVLEKHAIYQLWLDD